METILVYLVSRINKKFKQNFYHLPDSADLEGVGRLILTSDLRPLSSVPCLLFSVRWLWLLASDPCSSRRVAWQLLNFCGRHGPQLQRSESQ